MVERSRYDADAGETLVVRTRSGLIRGSSDGTVASWKGIPYAAAPVGERRFRAPAPAEPWEGIRDACRYGPIPPQPDSGPLSDTPPGAAMSEDCLLLNIWVPCATEARASETRTTQGGETLHAVMVWIHGGAYLDGSGSQAEYAGTALAENGDVLVVTFDYRLGALGHMDFRCFTTDDHVFDSNLALRDQVAALQWVRENIAAFGGDPDRVTIFGESAGGNAVTTLLVTPAARGLFSAAIAESSHPTSAHDSQRKAAQAHELLDLLEIPGHAAAERLRTISSDDLVRAGSALEEKIAKREPGVLVMCPTMDGDYLPQYPMDAFRAGSSHHVPLLIGTNRDEATIFQRYGLAMMPAGRNELEQMLRLTDPTAIGRIESAYSRHGSKRTWLDVSTDGIFRVPAIEVAENHAEHSPTWMYRFDLASPFQRFIGLRAAHGCEVPFVFGTFQTPAARSITRWMPRSIRDRTRTLIMGYWASFARDRLPVGQPHWPQYTRDSRHTLVVGRRPHIEADPQRAGRLAWTGVHRYS
jgi:para-nitrobenzyl esterase